MKVLKAGDILKILNNLKEKYGNKLLEAPVVLGDDEELNGVHSAFFCQEIDTKNPKGDDLLFDIEDIKYQTEWIEFDKDKKEKVIKYEGLTILIS